MDFCKDFNAKTQKMPAGMPVPVVITAFEDRTFTYIIKKPPVSYFLKKELNLQKGSSATGRSEPVADITRAQILEVVAEKMEELNAHTEEAAYQMVRGSALSMGLRVVE